MKGIIPGNLAHYTGQSGSLGFQKNNFMNYNIAQQAGGFNSYLKKAESFYQNTFSQPKAPMRQEESQGEFEERSLERSNQIDDNELRDKTRLESPSYESTIRDKFKEAAKKLAEELEEDEKDQLKESKDQGKSEWDILIGFLDKAFQGFTKETQKEKPEGLEGQWKKSLGELQKLGQSNKNSLLKELKEFFAQWKDVFKEMTGETERNGNLDVMAMKNKASKESLDIKGMMKELQSLFEEQLHKSEDEQSPIRSGTKISKTNIQHGIKVLTVAEKVKLGGANENQSREGETQSVTQKGEVKLIQSLEGGENSKQNSDLLGKPTYTDRGLRLPLGSTIKQPNELFDQIVSKASVLLSTRRSEMQIQLEPKILGQASLKIIVEDGVVSGRFIVEDRAVKSFLEQNIHVLKESLEARGLEFNQIDIYLGSHGQDSDFERETHFGQMSLKQNRTSNDNLGMPEEVLSERHMVADWIAHEVNLVV
ncbi:MAG: hypothetical protein IEMM0008_0849 [bacterium]|nr:MAG: hypothetical protein IEMM0008_0849 [bacterium]